MSTEELFDEKTKENLEKHGIVMASSKGTISYAGFENSFHILSQDQPLMHEALYETVVRGSILRAQKYAKIKGDRLKEHFPQMVFLVYAYLPTYFNYLKGTVELYLPAKEADETKYDPNIHYDFLRFPCLSLEVPSKMLRASANGENVPFISDDKLPTKEIEMKTQGGKYN